jgi:hypothetical protein
VLSSLSSALSLIAAITTAAATAPTEPTCEIRAFEERRRYGYKDAQGNVLIEPRYYKAHPCFSEGLAAIWHKDRWFYIDTSGEIVIDRPFLEAHPFRDGHARVRTYKGWRTIDREGEEPSKLSPAGMLRVLRGAEGAGPLFPVIWVICCVLISIGASYARRRRLRRVRLIRGTPTSRIAEARTGPIEIKGKTRAISPLKSPYRGVPCVWWQVVLQEEHRDSERRRSWRVIASHLEAPPFLVEDRSGTARLDPQSAEVIRPSEHVAKADGSARFEEVCRLLKVDPRTSILARKRTLRMVERALPVGARVYVLGFARRREPGVEAAPDQTSVEIFRDQQREVFIISTRSEQELLTSSAASAATLRVIFHLANAIGLFFLLRLIARLLS